MSTKTRCSRAKIVKSNGDDRCGNMEKKSSHREQVLARLVIGSACIFLSMVNGSKAYTCVLKRNPYNDSHRPVAIVGKDLIVLDWLYLCRDGAP